MVTDTAPDTTADHFLGCLLDAACEEYTSIRQDEIARGERARVALAARIVALRSTDDPGLLRRALLAQIHFDANGHPRLIHADTTFGLRPHPETGEYVGGLLVVSRACPVCGRNGPEAVIRGLDELGRACRQPGYCHTCLP